MDSAFYMKPEGSFCASKSPPLVLVTSKIKTDMAQSILVSIKIHFNIILHCMCMSLHFSLVKQNFVQFYQLPVDFYMLCPSYHVTILMILLLMMILKVIASLSYGILTYTSRWVALLLCHHEGPVFESVPSDRLP